MPPATQGSSRPCGATWPTRQGATCPGTGGTFPGWALPFARDIAAERPPGGMTADAFASSPALPGQEHRDVFAAAARRRDTVPGYIKKDFWVCLVLDTLFNRLPSEAPEAALQVLDVGDTGSCEESGGNHPDGQQRDLAVSGFRGIRPQARSARS